MSLTLFTDLLKATGSNVFTGPKRIVNDAVGRTNFGALHWLWRGQDRRRIMQGGDEISDQIYLNNVLRSRAYRPNDPQSYTMPQFLSSITAPWRFRMTDAVWTDEEETLNSNSSVGSNGGAQKVKDLLYAKFMDLATDLVKDMDNLLWAVPDTTKMESASGLEPFSIPSMVNEFSNGLPSAAHPGGVWTTKQGLSPTAAGQTNWTPTQVTYLDVGPVTAPAPGLLIPSLDRAMMRTEFAPPPIRAEYFEPASANEQRAIFTSEAGVVNLRNSCRAANDRWDERSDPATGFWMMSFKGVPVIYCAQLDTAAIFPTGAAGALSTELVTTNGVGGPRYFGINAKYMTLVLHAKKIFQPVTEDGMRDITQPTTTVYPLTTYLNLFTTSLKRHFILYPSADVTPVY